MRDWLTCSHCQSSTVLIGSKLLSETLAINPDNGQKNDTHVPTILEALSLILGFHFPQPGNEDGQWFSGSCIDYTEMDGDPERHLSLCYSCELVLVNLYKVFNLFTSLSNSKESFILRNSLITAKSDCCTEYANELPIPGKDVEVICIEPETDSILGRLRSTEHGDSEQGDHQISDAFQGSHQDSDKVTTRNEGEDSYGEEEIVADPLQSSPDSRKHRRPIRAPSRRRKKRRARTRKVPVRFRDEPEPKPTPALSVIRTRKRKPLPGSISKQLQLAVEAEPERDYRSLSSRHFRCEECGRVYMTAASLLVHTTSAHDYTTSQTQCPICKRSFAFKSYLSVHMRYHSGERPYTCSIETCGETFIQLSDLRRHEKRHMETGLPVIYVRRNRNRPGAIQEFGDGDGSIQFEYDEDLNIAGLPPELKSENGTTQNSELVIVSTTSLFNAS